MVANAYITEVFQSMMKKGQVDSDEDSDAFDDAGDCANRIQELIVKETRKVNKAGVYLVRFYINGVRRIVRVDDYIPT